jgi:decaprenyl-phosphate phosphoribosyltransferase
MKALLQLLRVRQWVKNGFVLAPLFFGSVLLDRDLLTRAAMAFVLFCFVSSMVYIINDWRDRQADSLHVKKRYRPLASGAISTRTAFIALVILAALTAGLGFASTLPKSFFVMLAIYVVVNLGYSLGLKHVSLVELFLVASGFVVRLLAGAFAIQIYISQWILIATAMIALVLTVGKRRDDIAQQYDAEGGRKSLEQYNLAYLDLVLASLTGGTLVVYMLFCASDYAVERFGSAVLVTAIPVAFGLLRYLQLVTVKGKGASPTDLVLEDPGLIASLGVFVAIFAVLIY